MNKHIAILATLLVITKLVYAPCGICEATDIKTKTEEKKATKKVEAMTTPTPKLKEFQSIVTGKIFCTACELKEQKEANSQCELYGWRYAIKAKK